MNNIIDHSYIISKADNKYVLFLEINPSLLEKDVDISLNNKELILTFEDGLTLSTTTLSEDIYINLSNNNTLVIFTDNDGKPIANYMLEPLKPIKRLKP